MFREIPMVVAIVALFFLGAWIVIDSARADDDVYLGEFGGSDFNTESTENESSTYGSRYGSRSINNPYGEYGSEFSTESPNNKFSTDGLSIYSKNF